MFGGARGIPEGPCCAMIMERIACTKRARRAGLATAGAASSFTSSGRYWSEVCVSVFAEGIGDGERVLSGSARALGIVLATEEGACVSEFHDGEGGIIISAVG